MRRYVACPMLLRFFVLLWLVVWGQTDANLPPPTKGDKITVTLDRWLRCRYKHTLPGNIAIVANISDASNIFNFTVGDNAEKCVDYDSSVPFFPSSNPHHLSPEYPTTSHPSPSLSLTLPSLPFPSPPFPPFHSPD